MQLTYTTENFHEPKTRNQIYRIECPKQTPQSPNTAQIRSLIHKGDSFFWDNHSSSQTPDIYLTPFERPHPCHRGNSTGCETSTEAFKFHTQNYRVKEKPIQASSNVPVCRMQNATQIVVIRTTTFLSKSSSFMSQCPTTHWGLLKFTYFLPFHLWFRNNHDDFKFHIYHTLCIQYSFKTIFASPSWTESIGTL